jgi:arylsulfatase
VNAFGDEPPYDGAQGYFPNQNPRAAYAAMITKLDEQIGEIKQKLDDLGLTENTIIVITSDNGPTYTGGVDFDFFESSKPFTNGYGRTKGFVYEGGIRVPMLVNWPGQVEAGSKSDHISIFYDWLPTICELVGIPIPRDTDGESFLAAIFGKPQKAHEYLYWEYPEYGGQQAIRMGKWKAIRQNIVKGNSLEIELYDLESDPQEQVNLASSNVDIISRMEEVFIKAHSKSILERFQMPALGD